ncbi:hypothetical protein QR680_012045 [Steinernema hermaphroditum]|nr:hypothetical protein QR680_012045 [Steinernema hermaphroditum]
MELRSNFSATIWTQPTQHLCLLCSTGLPGADVEFAVKLNGVGYECADLYHKVHKSDSGKFLLQIFLINHSERHDITVLAKKAVPPHPEALSQ